jgi:hypothetical protein
VREVGAIAVCAGSFFLCFNAGYINVLTMRSYYKVTSSHVTGLVAKVSRFLFKGSIPSLIQLLLYCADRDRDRRRGLGESVAPALGVGVIPHRRHAIGPLDLVRDVLPRCVCSRWAYVLTGFERLTTVSRDSLC